jgi:putative copper export protein
MWQALVWIHLIAMAFFVGGQLFMAAAVVPVLRGDETGKMQQVARRFGYGTLIAIGVSILTGSALASHYALWQDPKMHAKLGLVVLVGVLVLIHMKKPKLHVLDALIFVGSLGIVWLGVGLAELVG